MHFLGTNVVIWSSKKQNTTSRSSVDIEYRCLVNATAKVIWLLSLLNELLNTISTIQVLWCDSMSVVALTTNPILHSKAKYIDLDYHFIIDKKFQK